MQTTRTVLVSVSVGARRGEWSCSEKIGKNGVVGVSQCGWRDRKDRAKDALPNHSTLNLEELYES
jgi:hypothetical protein